MRRPTILQIVVDDMGIGDLSCNNFGASHTPALDQLFAEGVCLTQHYSAAPVCAPARASLLTGRYPHRTGAIDTLEGRGLDRLALRERTLADVLSQAGYATGLVGKWHNGALDPRFHPNRRGFAEFVGFRGGWQDYRDWHLDRNGTAMHADGRYLTDVITDEAIDFLRRHRHEASYLQVAYNAPHFPFQAPDALIDRFAESGALNRTVATIYAMLHVLDAGIARLLEEVDDDTFVMFTSDNGPQLGGQGEASTNRFNCGFNGAKGFVYEGGIRVPAVVRWPGGLDGRRSVHAATHFTDWMPTLMAAAGVATDDGRALDGCNVLPVLRGEHGDVPSVRFWQWNRYEPVAGCNAAMRDGDWKLVCPSFWEAMTVSPEDQKMDVELKAHPDVHTDISREPFPPRALPEARPAPQLFNLAADPLEQHDLAALQPERASRMGHALGEWFESVERERRAIAS